MSSSNPNWLPSVEEKRTVLRRSLLAWYRKHARDLPWRRTNDPYKIWLSEIMLQQTRVEAVIPYYERFLNAFPTVVDLAKANEDRVLKLWEGLGYYNRAHNLKKGAEWIVNECGGDFPNNVEGWLQVPGVGRYTAGAISSIAFDEQAPLVDGNVKRVFSRLFAVEQSIEETQTIQAMWNTAEILVPKKNPGDFNQSLMELGARICLPKNPKCGECPAKKQCEAYVEGNTSRYPLKKKKEKVPHVQVVAAAIKKNGRYLLGKRPEGKLLAGLWEFPGGKVEPGESPEEALARELLEELDVKIKVGEFLIQVEHAYSHYSVSIRLYACEIISGQPKTLYHSALKWITKKQMANYALPKANLKFLDLL
jgi:A/G-specific adenine glycosylase